jgi:1-acyl-sn-glycerol-3-phosphate acyltransferase
LRLAYGAYAWAALLACVAPVVCLLAATPGLERRRRIARRGARAFLALIGSPPRVHGTALARHPACVVVANHASYIDGIVLTAVLPAGFTFLIKHEMAGFPVAGFILRRIGSEFVDRNDARHRSRMARRLVTAAREGEALALFPEGTFRPLPGLRRFQLGAFGAAWQAKLPVVPAVIRGSRAKLPAGALLPVPGTLSVCICAPLPADRFESARALMRASRLAILEHLDEPDLDGLEEEPPVRGPLVEPSAP